MKRKTRKNKKRASKNSDKANIVVSKRSKPTVSTDQFNKILNPFIGKDASFIAAMLKMSPAVFMHILEKYKVHTDNKTQFTQEQLWPLRYYLRTKMNNLYPEQKGSIEFQQYKTQKAIEKSTLGTGRTPFDLAKRFGVFKILYTRMKG